ncbi:MAG: 5-(carboxyamino)imidazole ribonucleotide synthase [Gemmataceae bacterium]|nr:5-(carboxyamino)imidazole ribonucleotide synthase [Gemmataceae bacterium]
MNVGILGGGQLGKMLGWTGIPLGVRCRFLEPDPDAPAGVVGEVVHGSFQAPEVLCQFGQGLDVVTYEFENVPVEAAEFLARRHPVFPPPLALKVSQDRLAEKQFAQGLGIETPAFVPVGSRSDLAAGLKSLGRPAVLKTRRFGYDGRGQWLIRTDADADAAWASLNHVPAILEAFVPFDRELSIIAVRSRQGLMRCYSLIENRHEGGILRQSIAPAPNLAATLTSQAEAAAQAILSELSYVGVLAIEFFDVGGRLLFNEMAPRVHNSGHWSIEGAVTSQFENHLRAILGWELGEAANRGVSAMLNLIGTTPPVEQLLRVPGAHVHLYGKAPRPGRKLGHVTVIAESNDELQQRLGTLREIIASQDLHQAAHQAEQTSTPS